MKTPAILGEQFTTKVGAVFASREQAGEAAEAVADRTGVDRAEVRLIEPADPRESRKLEPESRGIRRTLVRAHVTLGLAGAVIGAAVAGVLLLTGIGAFTASPWVTLGWIVAFGAVGGLLMGGFVSLRPDHDPLNMKIEESLKDGRHWAVVVHVSDRDHAHRVREVLEEFSGRVMATL